jgi:hypothetical protein
MSAGYENIVQIRALLEGVQVSDILHRWHEVLPQKMQEWDVGRAQLVELFGSTRDQWMAEDLQGWLAPNRMYPKVTEAMKTAMASEEFEVYIVTTKQVCRKADACLLQLKYAARKPTFTWMQQTGIRHGIACRQDSRKQYWKRWQA